MNRKCIHVPQQEPVRPEKAVPPPFHSPPFLCALYLAGLIPAAASPRPAADSICADSRHIKTLIELINRSEHDSVLALSRDLIGQDPASPLGYFIAADSYQTMMRDFRIKAWQTEFDSLIAIASGPRPVWQRISSGQPTRLFSPVPLLFLPEPPHDAHL